MIARHFFDKENCQLSVLAKLPFGVSRPVVLERHCDLVETSKAVNGSRRWHQPFVVIMPFESKGVVIRPAGGRYEFVTHNSTFDFGVTLLTGRLVEWQINFCKGVAGNLINRCLCFLWRKRWIAEKVSGVA